MALFSPEDFARVEARRKPILTTWLIQVRANSGTDPRPTVKALLDGDTPAARDGRIRLGGSGSETIPEPSDLNQMIDHAWLA